MHDLPARDMSFPWLSGLNPPQREAVETIDGPLLVLAGAGTGKTKVLTARLAHILKTGRAWPSQILAVTFTNRAAQEMRERVSALMDGQPVEGWWLGTFHALAARMLRRHAELAGLSSNFTILDPDDQSRLMKQLMEAENIDTKKWPPRQVMAIVERWKDKGLLPENIRESEAGEAADGKALKLYLLYQQRLKAANACDFGDLLLHTITILRTRPDVLAEYHRRFKYILVDEYQDTNVAQYLWLRLLAKKGASSGYPAPGQPLSRHPERSEGSPDEAGDPSVAALPQDDTSGLCNICCVGDDDQSIYGWRGAEVGNILRFERDFPGAKIIRLEQNYRSTGHILGAANGVIAQNEGRLGKTLFTAAGEGEKIAVRGLWDGEAEARWVAEEIEQLQHKGWGLDQIAVLVRAGFQTREFEERFIQLGLSYRVIGGPRFYERAEIRDALAYLRVIAQPADDLALERIINTPRRGLGDSTVQVLYAYARAQGISLHASILNLTQTDEIKPKPRGALMKLMDDFARWRGLSETMKLAQLAAQVLDDSGYMEMWKLSKELDAPGRIENLKELVSGMAAFESLPAFLEHVALVFENQEAATGPQISLMTLHGAKGLEFDAVFLPGWEDGLFPSQRTMDENGLKGLEEERRLAYVGITRARRQAFISFAANRRTYGNWISAIPSRFIDELPPDHVEVGVDKGLYGGQAGGAGRSGPVSASYHPPPLSSPLPGGRSLVNPLHPASFLSLPPDKGGAREGGKTAAGADPSRPFARGDRVFHEKFGGGTIVNIDGHKLDIAFDEGGHKRVMDGFVVAET